MTDSDDDWGGILPILPLAAPVEGSQPTEVGDSQPSEVAQHSGQAIESQLDDGAATTEQAHEPQQHLRRERKPHELGSQPTEMVLTAVGGDGPPVHIGIATSVFFYGEDDETWQMLDEKLLQRLSDDQAPQWYWRRKSGKAQKRYWVDLAALRTTSDISKKERPMCRQFMFEVPIHAVPPSEQTTIMGLLVDDGWKFAWQFRDNHGWKNMQLAASERLLEALEREDLEVDIEHWWKHPQTDRWNRSMYVVDMQGLHQKSRQGTDRAVRLVALAP